MFYRKETSSRAAIYGILGVFSTCGPCRARVPGRRVKSGLLANCWAVSDNTLKFIVNSVDFQLARQLDCKKVADIFMIAPAKCIIILHRHFDQRHHAGHGALARNSAKLCLVSAPPRPMFLEIFAEFGGKSISADQSIGFIPNRTKRTVWGIRNIRLNWPSLGCGGFMG